MAATRQLLVLPAPPSQLSAPWPEQINEATDAIGAAESAALRRNSAASTWESDGEELLACRLPDCGGDGIPLSTVSSAGMELADSPADRLLRKARLRINDWLLEAATPAAVLRLVSQHGASFNSVNVATALHRLARLVQKSPDLPPCRGLLDNLGYLRPTNAFALPVSPHASSCNRCMSLLQP